MAALAAAGGLSILGGLYASRERKKAVGAANDATQRQVAGSLAAIKGYEGKSNKLHEKSLGAVTAGYDEARKHTGILGAAARRRVERREKRAQGRADATAMDRGLSGSSTSRGMRRAIQSDTDLSLAAIDESVSAAHATIARDRGHALAQLFESQAGRMTSYAGLSTGVRMAPTHVAADMSGIGQGMSQLGMLLGLYSGMNDGGGGGWTGSGGYGPFPGA